MMRGFVLERFSLGSVVCDRGVQIFQKYGSHQKILGDMKQVAYWGHTDIRRHRTEFSPSRATWHPGFVQFWLMAFCQCFVIPLTVNMSVFHLIMAVRHVNVIVNILGVHYSIVSIATRLRAGRSGVWIPAEQRHFFSSPNRWDRLWGPLSLLCSGYRSSFPGVKRSGRDILQSPQSSSEVNERSRTSASPLCLFSMDWSKSTGLHNLIWNPLCMLLHYSLEQICRLGVWALFERSLRFGVASCCGLTNYEYKYEEVEAQWRMVQAHCAWNLICCYVTGDGGVT